MTEMRSHSRAARLWFVRRTPDSQPSAVSAPSAPTEHAPATGRGPSKSEERGITEALAVQSADESGLDEETEQVHHEERQDQLRRQRKSDETLSLFAALDDAALLVEYLQGLIPAWRTFPQDERGLREILYGTGWNLHEDWYRAQLKDLLARAGDAPMDLPRLAALLNSTGRSDLGSEFTPRQALAKLIFWTGKLWDEDTRLMEMEATLRNVERLWRRQDLFVLWELFKSASAVGIARREDRRSGMAFAQREFVDALGQRDPALGVAYRQCRNAYQEAKDVREYISWTEALRGGRYDPERAIRNFDDNLFNRYRVCGNTHTCPTGGRTRHTRIG
jgi:hypothetical protein